MRDFLAEDLETARIEKADFIAEREAIILEGCRGRLGLAQAQALAQKCWERYSASCNVSKTKDK